ncbi:MAG: putative fusion protein (N:peptidase-C:desuccinylase) [Parcubacteria group bacterium LiPW_39]|nr:MAG: putative fusion protein (N:peptidase-C:desuccinylase) [Parcubacteria group bacterium LiPW_39]
MASLKMVLDYFGVKISEPELIKFTGATARKGTSAKGIRKAARKLGFLVRIKDRTDLADIKYWLDKKIPPIVAWFSEDDGHYSVVAGLDKKFIYLQDPEIAGIRKMKKKDFKRVWFDFEGDFIKNKNDLILRRLIIIVPD